MARGHQGRRLHHPHQRRAALRPVARRSRREDARRPRQQHQADHRPSRPRQAVRRRADPRADRAPPGQVGDQGRHRRHQHQHVRRQHRRGDQGGAGCDRQGDRRQAARLCRRPSLEPRRPARPGDRGERRLPRARRDRLAARPREERHRALLRPPRRPRARAAGDRSGRCWEARRPRRSSPERFRITAALW